MRISQARYQECQPKLRPVKYGLIIRTLIKNSYKYFFQTGCTYRITTNNLFFLNLQIVVMFVLKKFGTTSFCYYGCFSLCITFRKKHVDVQHVPTFGKILDTCYVSEVFFYNRTRNKKVNKNLSQNKLYYHKCLGSIIRMLAQITTCEIWAHNKNFNKKQLQIFFLNRLYIQNNNQQSVLPQFANCGYVRLEKVWNNFILLLWLFFFVYNIQKETCRCATCTYFWQNFRYMLRF
eukprot:TRINITY_DN14252_c0_g6_i1.p2 TRINITY_DN14252_c0_g6~~TRINITY_DN14252_c0_g6_i1.p2  ORF type:complete len:253 (+),score=-19.90 TRINITY_DN14252_c0_g6_i1:60-761(+)